MVKQSPPPETLGSVPINGGISSAGKPYGGNIVNGRFMPHEIGDLRREVDPTGKIVEHRVRKSTYVHERLHSLNGPQKLADELYDAAEKFRLDFERAQLTGSYARTDLFRTRAGKTEISDNVAIAKMRISKALNELGNGKDSESLSQSCAWNVVGLGLTLEGWTALIRRSGGSMYTDKSSGILLASLERLALHYGIVDRTRLDSIARDKSFGRGVKTVNDFVLTIGPRPDETASAYVCRFRGVLAQRFAMYLG
jgi:hypothetical protein